MANELEPLEVLDALLAGVVKVPAEVAARLAAQPAGDDTWRRELEALAEGRPLPRGLIEQLTDVAGGKQPAPHIRELLAAFAKSGGEE